MIARLPANEAARLEDLRSYEVLDTPRDEAFERFTRMAAGLLHAPIALVTLIDEGRQWIRACHGFNVSETPRDVAFCAHAILCDEVTVVPDATLDPRFANNPLVTGAPGIRFYAGAPLRSSKGSNLGTLCVVDTAPRTLSQADQMLLADLAGLVVNQLERVRAETRLRRELADRALAEEKALASEAKFRAVAQSIGDAIISSDAAGDVIFWNSGAERIFGRSEAEALGKPLELIMPERFRPMHRAGMQRLQAGSEARVIGRTVELIGLAADGREFPVEVTFSTWKANEGVFYTGIVRDISVRKGSEEALREAKRFAESIAGSSTSIIYVFDLDTRTNVYENRNVADVLGYSPAEIAEKGAQLLPSLIHPDDLARVLQHFGDFIDLGDSGVADIEYRVRNAAGEWRWIWARETIFKRHENGQPWQIMGTAQDITERLRTEQELKEAKVAVALREGEERYMFLADTVPQIVWTSSPDGALDYYNKAWFDYTGLSLEETIDWGWGMVLHPDDLQRCVDRWAYSFTTGENYEIEYRFKRASDGTYRWHLGRALPQRNEAGEIVRWVGTCTDIDDAKRAREILQTANDELGIRVLQRTSELHAAKESAEAANRAKSEFLANMSHEIRTPMNGVLGMTELVLDSDLNPEQREHLGMARSSARALLGLINDILDFSKIEAGKLELEVIGFGVRETISQMLEPLKLRARQKGLVLEAVIASDVPDDLLGDPLRLRQVLLNFVSNALKFTELGSIIVRVDLQPSTPEASLAQWERCLHFSVRDTGIGIPAEKQSVIFEAFAQVDGSTTRTYGGTGLGLTIASKLIDQMRGQIWLESKVGEGTTFHCTALFGVGQSEVKEAAPIEAARAPASGSTPMLRILLAEDNVINRALATAILERRGHTLAHAGTGLEAVKALQADRFDLIFMDVQMPEMDGFEATRRIRDLEKGTSRRTPIVAMTAHAMSGDRDRCLAAGMDDYISKPLEKEALLEILMRWSPAAPECLIERLRPPEVATPCRTFSRAKLLDEFDGDEEILGRIIHLFSENTPVLLEDIRTSIEEGSAERLARSAHALLSSLGTFGAKDAHRLTKQLEDSGRAGTTEGAETTFAALSSEVAAVEECLREPALHCV